MRIINATYQEATTLIKAQNKKIIVYGAGMIGQVVVPYLLDLFDLYDYVECFVDADKRKQGKILINGKREYEVKAPDYLEEITGDRVVFITNSRFYSIIRFLNSVKNLDNSIGYVIPIMQLNDLEKRDTQMIPFESGTHLIPKTIHYCWFGKKEMPLSLQECIKSWKKYCPDYNIMEWNEENYDIGRHRYTEEAYQSGKYGFVTDIVRLDVLYEYGGIYFDTDVTLEKNIDDYLRLKGFVATEKWGNINTGGGCGFIAGHPVLKELIEYRDNVPFLLEDGSINAETNGLYETSLFLKKGYKPNNEMQIIDDVVILPSYINHPYDYMSCELKRRDNTVSVHHFNGGWMEKEELDNRRATQIKYRQFIEEISQ